MRTGVAIVGAGPAGLLLSQILRQEGVDCVVIERQSREYVLGRIRAGVLEPTTVEVLRQYGLAERLEKQGHPHDGMKIAWAGRDSFLIDIQRHLGKRFVAYGQTNLQEDLFAAVDRERPDPEQKIEPEPHRQKCQHRSAGRARSPWRTDRSHPGSCRRRTARTWLAPRRHRSSGQPRSPVRNRRIG